MRIATDNNRFYEVFLNFSVNIVLPDGDVRFTQLYPNNSTYIGGFQNVSVRWGLGVNNTGVVNRSIDNDECFYIYCRTPHSRFTIDTFRRILRGIVSIESDLDYVHIGLFASKWHSNLSSWSSLGSLVFPVSMSGYVLIRRLV